jgi:hypothetical protein
VKKINREEIIIMGDVGFSLRSKRKGGVASSPLSLPLLLWRGDNGICISMISVILIIPITNLIGILFHIKGTVHLDTIII